jgi:hypothetical protein
VEGAKAFRVSRKTKGRSAEAVISAHKAGIDQYLSENPEHLEGSCLKIGDGS